MGRKSKSSSTLGRCLIKDRFGSANKGRRAKDSSLLHTAEVNDGYDWGRLNLQSVTEESSFQEFLSTAELAGTEFQSEKLNITFVNPLSGAGLLSDEERALAREAQDKNKQLLGIPRRPKWDSTTTPEELELAERESFLDWRRRLAILSEMQGLLLTPYEKNLEFWRQLWRVVERSDVVVQIVDARNPLLFRCEDLESYVTESSEHKMNVILLNKADFLTEEQREVWAQYFEDLGVRVAFFSATLAAEKETIPEEDENSVHEDTDSDEETDKEDEVKTDQAKADDGDSEISNLKSIPQSGNLEETTTQPSEIVNAFEKVNLDDRASCVLGGSSLLHDKHTSPTKISNSAALLSREELIEMFKCLHHAPKVTEGVTTIGLVGYPNVGKSSTINALMTVKKVSVSATPGKTKHFQTLFLDKDLLLCDCPGLVMPSFVLTKAEMITNGILPIDQMRDHVPAVTLVAELIPKYVLEAKYGLMLPAPREEEDPKRPPTSQELCNAYGYNRGFMTQNGLPDNPRSSRYILKDFVNGKLLYCHAPPGITQEEFHSFPENENAQPRMFPPISSKMLKSHKMTGSDLDKLFFNESSTGIHSKGVERVGIGNGSISGSTMSLVDQKTLKPWKDHTNKRNKKQKLRRIYSHLDA